MVTNCGQWCSASCCLWIGCTGPCLLRGHALNLDQFYALTACAKAVSYTHLTLPTKAYV